MSIRSFKQEIHGFLQREELDAALEALRRHPPQKLLKPLFSGLCSCDALLKWHAVSAMGQTVALLADQDLEAARVVMRRLMWMLNDESGGIGWGAPEAIGEITACHAELAKEYGHMLVSYMREDGFYLELEALQAGLMWAVGRLAERNPALLIERKAPLYLRAYLQSKNAAVRGHAVAALGKLQAREALADLQGLCGEDAVLSVYREGRIISCTVGALATQAITDMRG